MSNTFTKKLTILPIAVKEGKIRGRPLPQDWKEGKIQGIIA